MVIKMLDCLYYSLLRKLARSTKRFKFVSVLSISLCIAFLMMTHKEKVRSPPNLAPISAYATHPNVDLTKDQCADDFTLSRQKRQENSKEARHIGFLKVHKAASSTLFNIFYRFGQERDLTFIVPRYEHVLGTYTSMRKRHIFPPPGNKTFDMACLHAIFEKEVYEAYLPNDSVYIATIREPLDRLTSAFWYYRRIYELPYLSNIPGPNVFHNFLMDPAKYEIKDVYYSATNNRMALDFGYPANLFHNISRFKEYLKTLNSRFDLVLDTKLFPESVILMKRMLNWTLQDVIYMSQNKMKMKPSELTKDMKAAARRFLKLDFVLYEHFITRLRSTINQQDRGFMEEVANLKHVQHHVSVFCSRLGFYDMGKKLVIGASKWNKGFIVDFCDCSHMMLKELPAVEILKNIARRKLEKYGPNKEFFLSRPM